MKKKIFAIALAAFLFALSIVGSSVAYFTDVDEKTSVFTAGKVDITLTYDGASPLVANNPNVYPGQIFDTVATIKNVGTEMAYVGAIITLSKVGTVIDATGGANDIPVAVSKFITGLENGATVKVVKNSDTITIYVIKTAVLATNAACMIFDDVAIPDSWDHAQMGIFNNGFKIDVKAYATQTQGFADAEEAITTAFATAWENYN